MKSTRRGFLRHASAAAAISVASSGALVGSSPSGPDAKSVQSGDQVPATLDLAERGQLALNGLAGTLDRENVPEFYFRVNLAPPTFIHDAISFAACGPKYWEAFVMARAMTGGDSFQDMEERYRRFLLSCIGDDGLFYCKVGAQRPGTRAVRRTMPNLRPGKNHSRLLRNMCSMGPRIG